MSKRAFDKIMAGVKEARAYLNGTADKARYRVHAPRERKDPKGLQAREAVRRSLRRSCQTPQHRN